MTQTLTYTVPNMSCDHCKLAIAETLKALPAVQDVAVYISAQRVTVTGENLDDQALLAAIRDAGYEVRP